MPNPNATHLGILMDDAAIDVVLRLVQRLQHETPALQGTSRKAAGSSNAFGRIKAALSASF